jgi:hypothetical protein
MPLVLEDNRAQPTMSNRPAKALHAVSQLFVRVVFPPETTPSLWHKPQTEM